MIDVIGVMILNGSYRGKITLPERHTPPATKHAENRRVRNKRRRVARHFKRHPDDYVAQAAA